MTITDLGIIQRQFKPGMDNLVAGVIIGLLLFGGGGAAVFYSVKGVVDSRGELPFWAEKSYSWGVFGLGSTLGIGMMIGGYYLLRWMRSLSSLRVNLCQNGLTVEDHATLQIIPWDEIQLVTEIHLYERPPILKGVAKYALPKMMSRSFALKRKKGDGFCFDGTTIKGHTELAEMIKIETDSRNIPWEIQEVHA
jgi:hypothetical protein